MAEPVETIPPDWPRRKDGKPRRPPPPFPQVPGVYVFRFGGEAYSGGSLRVYARVDDHLRALSLGTHENPAVQAVFNQADRLTVEIRKMPGATSADVLDGERRVMASLILKGARLLNHNIPHRADDYDGRLGRSSGRGANRPPSEDAA